MAADDDEETLDYIAEILEIVAEVAGVETEVVVEEENGAIVAEYLGEGDELAVLIGHHGQSLDAIEHLAHRMAFRGMDDRKPLSLNAAGYRERRATALHAVADQAAEAAVRDGRPVSLDPMGAQERRLVHEYLKPRFDVETYSEGQEPARRLVVAPVVS